MSIFDLRKRVALVTGGNGGIGLGMAKGLSSAGAAVVIAGRNKTKARMALSELHARGAQAEFVELNVLEEASCRQTIQHAIERFGRLDILVNNAGTSVRKQPQASSARRRKRIFVCQRLRFALTSLRPVCFFARLDLAPAATRRCDLSLLAFAFAFAFDFARFNFEAVAAARLRLRWGAFRFVSAKYFFIGPK